GPSPAFPTYHDRLMRHRGGHPISRIALAMTIAVSTLLSVIGCPDHSAHNAAASASATTTTSAHQAYQHTNAPEHGCCRETPRATAIIAHPPTLPSHLGAAAEPAPPRPVPLAHVLA